MLIDVTILKELRGQRIAEAIESLEFTIDSAIVVAWHRLDRVDQSTRQILLDNLSAIRDYRRDFPRKPEAVIVEKPMLQNVLKVTRQAEEILQKVP